MHGTWPWVLMALLGAYHGLNPAMGWLFAVSLGLQDRSRRAVVRALAPIAVGHELAIVAVAVLVVSLGLLADERALRLGAAAVLIAFGAFRFLRPRAHFRWTTMRVNRRELTLWSFLMSTAHGAGLMVAPVLIGSGLGSAHAHGHGAQLAAAGLDGSATGTAALALLVHVGAMLLVMGAVALAVYDRFGTAILRSAWINTDGVWAGAFVLAGVATLLS
jgi:hypothetical protein